jgi:hypothetical protein
MILNKIIDTCISQKKLKEVNYLLSFETNKNVPISQPNFSKKVEQVFYMVYKEPISIIFLRMSWISALMKTTPTNKEIKELVNHSSCEQSKYNKIIK